MSLLLQVFWNDEVSVVEKYKFSQVAPVCQH
jgi:hypothetical protein